MAKVFLTQKEYILIEDFTPAMVWANILRLWKAEDIKAFYDMLGRRPETTNNYKDIPCALYAEMILNLFAGCQNHSCKVQKPTGQATNGPCQCAYKIRDFKERFEANLPHPSEPQP